MRASEKMYAHFTFTDNGTGIGLAIVKKITGIIAAPGIPGEGSRFDIYIPAG